MSVAFNLSVRHRVTAANSHWYHNPTAPLYLDRILECHDFVYLVEGEWLITENDTDFLLEKGDVLILSSGHHHYTRQPCLPDTRTICIHISADPGDVPGKQGSLMLPSLIHAGAFPEVKMRFEEIVSLFWREAAYRNERLSTLFDLLLFDLVDTSRGLETGYSALCDAVVRLINENPHMNYRLDEIQEKVNADAHVVNAAMKQRFGMTFSKYQHNVKLEMAAQFLKTEPEARLKEIAEMFGFCDEFHFSKAFKMKYGLSPSMYRDKSSGTE